MAIVSIHAHWLSRARAPQARAASYLIAEHGGEYSDGDVEYIIEKYWQHGEAVGIDPLLASVQMMHETGFLSSFWSQRPRRNPAGIGVTGEPGAGVSFPNWEVAVRAHIGRILAYTLQPGEGIYLQRAMVDEALTWRAMPDLRHGQGVDVETLARHWAADPRYAQKLVDLAGKVIG